MAEDFIAFTSTLSKAGCTISAKKSQHHEVFWMYWTSNVKRNIHCICCFDCFRFNFCLFYLFLFKFIFRSLLFIYFVIRLLFMSIFTFFYDLLFAKLGVA